MNERSIIDLLYLAKQNRIDLFLNEGQLQVKLPKDKAFDKSILEQLKANKEELTAFLSKNERGSITSNKITKADRNSLTHIPLSFSQERLWFVDQLEGSTKYHLPAVIRLKGQLETAALKSTLQTIVVRHEVLRTVILEENGQGYQELLDADNWQLESVDGLQYKDDPENLHEFVQNLIDFPFNLSKDYMLRAHLIMLAKQEHILLVTIHHIAADAWSMSVLVNEVIELYTSSITKRAARLQPLPIQYSDYAIWQRNHLQGANLDKKLNYWKEKLEGTTPLNLPLDYNRPAVWSSRGAITRFTINKKLSTSLQQLSKQYESTLFMTLLAAFKILLRRYSGQTDICVGTSVANRSMKEVEGLIGFFVNMLALRTEINDHQTFPDLLQKVKTTTLEGYENQDAPFEKVVDQVIQQRDMSKNPLIQVMMIMLNTPDVPDLRLGELTLSMEDLHHTKTLFDLSFFISETEVGLEGWVEYCTDIFSEKTIKQLIENFTELLTNISVNPIQKVGSIPILKKSEEHKLLIEFNDNKVAYPEDKSIVNLFEEQVSKTPFNQAVIFEEQKLTYAELNERANHLAHYLRTKGVREETLVPICIERSLELIVGILGILKVGGAYVPIDPKYPGHRIGFMLKDISADIILCSKNTKDNLSHISYIDTLVLDNDMGVFTAHASENLATASRPDSLAYIIYTSGSTGTPKGTMIEHKSVVSLVRGVDFVSSTSDDVLLSTGSPSFDATTFEYWSMLLNGGQLILCNENNLLDKDLLKAEIQERGVNKMWFTSSWFNQLVDTDITVFEQLKTVLVGGEKLSEQHIEKMRSMYPAINIINGYGPTENTTFSLTYLVKETEIKKAIPIGKPLANRSAYIVDENGELVPIGVTGEICVGGPGLARGYLNNERLTGEKFVFNKFGADEAARMYKTGDLGCWSADGNIQYQGRIDDQVKIRGFRIELGEIESVLGKFDGILQNVVLAKEDKNGRKRLVAFVVSNGGFNKESAISYLSEKLPDYMVPAFWVEMTQLPLTSNGKVDKKALPDPEVTETAVKGFAEASTELQSKLVKIWQDLLDVESVGIDDNFFELGGDSILAIQFVSRARNVGIEVKVADVFTYQTISQLSKLLDSGGIVSPKDGGNSEDLAGSCGLLPVQQWYFETQQVELSHFNQSVLLSIDKSIDENILNQAIEQILKQHDALRFRYYQQDGEWKQEYSKAKVEVKIEELIYAESEDAGGQINKVADQYQRSLDIEKGETVRVVLLKTPAAEKSNRLLWIIHHLVVDGVSWRLILEEFESALAQTVSTGTATSHSKTSSYKQWYDALEKYGRSSTLLKQTPYWSKTVQSFKPFVPDFDYSEKVTVAETNGFTLKLDADVTRSLLKEVPRVYHTEINDILLCALAKTLCNWTTKDQVVIGLEGHGREAIDTSIDISRTVGWFTSLYPVLINMVDTNGWDNLIKSVKEQLRQVPDKGVGFGVLRYINKEESLQGSEPWDIQFNYLGQVDNVVRESARLSVASEPTGAGRSEKQVVSEKLSVNSHIKAGQLVCVWRFSSKYFREETIRNLATSYLHDLSSLVTHCLEQGKNGAVYTPSDYGLGTAVSYEELDAFLEDESDNVMSF
ncbi:non-ribosomal peptide synthetase [Segetibacter aerophilus]|uniref:Carrier domain-containing protein n=1 Tax=Segetibacter aerophilus TaxID=670293 RepID=A0A512BJL2_9BACT|nr:non-ribosomal peptide synthetase [Segetibacter aerophilus]GEO12156.1 hypothetical protein SAE01_46520 [Segetibacter aerophilus]